jgi:predicted ArsR family transcriptional regulator
MPTVRQKILIYIKEQQSTTVEEISKVFRVTQANIRHHLSILVEQGSVAVIGQKAVTNRGRPAQIYSAIQEINQNNLEQLCDVLLAVMMQDFRANKPLETLKIIADQMVSKFNLATVNPTRRLYSTIQALNRMNYHARWEAHVDNPRIMLDHCPYRAILDQHPEVCRMDKYILEAFAGTPVRQAEKLIFNAKGLPRCVFLLNQSSL